MNPNGKREVSLSVGGMQVSGSGSRQMVDAKVASINSGLSQALQEVTGSMQGGNIHVDQLRLRLPVGARQSEITQAFREALVNAIRQERR